MAEGHGHHDCDGQTDAGGHLGDAADEVLLETNRLERAVAVYREAQQQFQRNPAIVSGLADTLIDLERLSEAQDVLDWADQLDMDEKSAGKREQIRQRLMRTMNGEPVRLKRTQSPYEGAAGDLDALADITSEDLSYEPMLGRAVLLRRAVDEADLDQARQDIDSLPPPGTIQLVETGLWHARAEGWRAAADWFDGTWERYAGDGVLRVHRSRAHARAGDDLDWSLEWERYPYLGTVIETEISGEPPARIRHIDPTSEDLTLEQRQDAWFLSVVDGGDKALRDIAEEDVLFARRLIG